MARFAKRGKSFAAVSIRPGSYVTRGEMARLHHRYYLAANYAKGRVLEVACGPGLGFGYVADRAQMAIAGDWSVDLLKDAVNVYRGKGPFLQLDAQQLPFGSGMFDLVFCFEAVFYFPDVGQFIAESYRVLKPGGRLLFSSLNNTRGDFKSMPLGPHLFSLSEFQKLLTDERFENIEFFGAFQLPRKRPPKFQVKQIMRSVLVNVGLLPSNVSIRNILKRATYRNSNLVVLKPVEAGFAPIEPTIPISPDGPCPDLMLVYATATR
jgi:ubiquinone/menaquinone biosynthesis C-methylase UbiE